MRTVFGHWKYLAKNIWFVLPFAILPAVFLALSLDYTAIGALVRGIFSGEPRLSFLGYFGAFGLLRFDSALGAVFDTLAFVTAVFFGAFLLSFVEKHLRIGKRTMSGVPAGTGRILFSMLAVTALYLVLYEVWAIVLSAICFAISAIRATPLVYVLFFLAFLATSFALVYVATIFYLWLPCRQLTGFGFYDAFVYSYRLMMGVRWRLIFAYAVSFLAGIVVVGGLSVTHEAIFRTVGVALLIVLFLSFTVRMETVYFAQDKLDREDELLSFRGYR